MPLSERRVERRRQRLRDRALAQFARKALADPSTHPLCRARLQAGLTVDELAFKADRLSPDTISAIEHRRSPGSQCTRRVLARALRLPVSRLFPAEANTL